VNPRLELLASGWKQRVSEATDFLTGKGFTGKVGLVLGSGLGNFVDAVEEAEALDFTEIPGFHAPTVDLHSGRLVKGTAAGVPVLVMQGRLHPYEGLPYAESLLPIAVLACLGIDAAVVTNAAGGLNRHYVPGDLMVICDQIDMHFHDPLRGLLADPFRPLLGRAELSPELRRLGRLGGLPRLFDDDLTRLLLSASADSGIPMHSGTYVSMYGPAFEAKAEIGMLRTIGCDAVGMSTVAETVLLKHLGVEPIGLSCITNPARETNQPELSHHDVVEVGAMVRDRMAKLLLNFLPRIP
jgi:purine-nucleoside phosphorylase